MAQCEDDSLIVAPEVSLTGFDYENIDLAMAFSIFATQELAKATKSKTLIITMLEQTDSQIYNNVKVFHKGSVIHSRAKARLFALGDEHKYMHEGNVSEIEIIEIDGVKVGILICFELRFKELWQKLEGSDVICVPSWWGAARAEHFRSLSQALAIMNQCYVIASDSANDECSGLGGIITPQGEEQRNGNTACFSIKYQKKAIALMRRYIDVGIE